MMQASVTITQIAKYAESRVRTEKERGPAHFSQPHR